MSQPNQKQDDTAAAVGFGAVLVLAAGGAGLLIAALAVGFERAWSRRGGGRTLRDAQRRDRYGDHLAWLAQDRAARDRYRRARQDWWQSGAHGDPPKGPGVGQRIGSWFRRRWARAYVGACDFRDGFAEGWCAADEARRSGARARDIARTRPQRQPAADDDQPDLGSAPATPPAGPAADEGERTQPTDAKPQPDQGDNVTHSNATPPPTSPSAPQGDSNAAVMAAHLQTIEDRLKAVSDLTDQLAAERSALEAEATAAAEFAEQTGQTADTRQSLDASAAVVAQLGDQVGGVSDSAGEAAEQVAAARQGLRVVEEAEDALTSAGADGRAVAPAGAAA